MKIKVSTREIIYTLKDALVQNREVYQNNVSILESGKVVSHLADRPPKEPTLYTFPMKKHKIPETYTPLKKAYAILNSKNSYDALSSIIELQDDFFVYSTSDTFLGEISRGMQMRGLLVITTDGDIRAVSYPELRNLVETGLKFDFRIPLEIFYLDPSSSYELEARKFLHWLYNMAETPAMLDLKLRLRLDNPGKEKVTHDTETQ